MILMFSLPSPGSGVGGLESFLGFEITCDLSKYLKKIYTKLMLLKLPSQYSKRVTPKLAF